MCGAIQRHKGPVSCECKLIMKFDAGLCVKLFRQVARICGAGIDRNVEPQEAMDPIGAF